MDKKIRTHCTVDWEKTKDNIFLRFPDYYRYKDIADIFNVDESTATKMMSPNSPRTLTIEELRVFSLLLRCNIEDLVVFEEDSFFATNMNRCKPSERNYEEVKQELAHSLEDNYDTMQEMNIRDLREMILYLPLMPPDKKAELYRWLFDGEFLTLECTWGSRYIKTRLNYYYETIADEDLRNGADIIRDILFRSKGHARMWHINSEFVVKYYERICAIHNDEIYQRDPKLLQMFKGAHL